MKAGAALLLTCVLLQGCKSGEQQTESAPQSSSTGGQAQQAGVTAGPAAGGGSSGVPQCSGLGDHFDVARPFVEAGSDGYKPPDSAALNALRSALDSAIAGDRAAAQAQSELAGYTLCELGSVWVWQGPLGHATFAVQTGDARPLQIEVPHAYNESGTLEEGLLLFEELSARSLLMTNTHRCGSNVASGCDGTTEQCGSSQPYRRSDMAHTVESAFQAVHGLLADHYDDDFIVSLHGMSREGISVSGGVQSNIAPDSHLAKLTDQLAVAFPAALVTTCSDYGAGNHEVHLCGTTNVQGRHLNGSANACTSAANQNSGRFFHLEQHSSVRAEPAKVVAAFNSVLPHI